MTFDPMHSVAAGVWLVLLVVASLVYLLWQIRNSPYTQWENVLYTPTYLFGRLLWRVRFTNSPPVEMRGGGVLVANHRSSVDPFFVQLSAGRRVHWMVAREYCENIVLGPLLRALQAIPTNRSGMDTGATKQAIRLAKEGRLVGMFPEGRLNHTRDPLVSVRSGAALVAVRAGVPIIPIYIKGSPYRREVWSPLFMPAQVKITFGEPIDPHEAAEQNAASMALESALAAAAYEATAVSDVASNHGSVTEEEQPRSELVIAERMILQWGKQLVTLAGRPDWIIEIAGRSRLSRAARESLQ